jgi:polysaccharide biosynthesis protein PslH
MRNSKFVNYFKKHAALDLLTLTNPTEETNADYIKNNFGKHYYFDPYSEQATIFEKLIYLLPWQLTEYYSKGTQEEINKIIENNQYDLIFVSKLQPLIYFARLSRKWRKRVIMDFDDILSDLYSTHYKNRFASWKNSFFLRINETRALKYFKRIFVCSKTALNKINGKYIDKVGVIPNVYDFTGNESIMKPKDKNQLLFVGSLDYFANTDGLKWFFDKIWPKVKQTYPQLKLTVIGKTHKDVPYIYSLLGQPKDTEIVLNVPDIAPYYKSCYLSIVPLLNGSGTRLKILESAAYGRPVISTTKGMEGLDFEENKQIFIFSDAESFIISYRQSLNDHIYQDMVQGSLGVVQTAYSQEAFQNSMEENWEIIDQ